MWVTTSGFSPRVARPESVLRRGATPATPSAFTQPNRVNYAMADTFTRRHRAAKSIEALLIGGMEDHIHVLLGIPPTAAVSEALKRIKGGSSGWIKQNIRGCRGFGWQDGYGAFTVSKSQDAQVKAYISKQRQHHRKENFQEEYRALLDRHEIEYDERYLWD